MWRGVPTRRASADQCLRGGVPGVVVMERLTESDRRPRVGRRSRAPGGPACRDDLQIETNPTLPGRSDGECCSGQASEQCNCAEQCIERIAIGAAWRMSPGVNVWCR